jgi:prephenate dehydrogenase
VSGADIVLLAVPVAATEATFKAIRHLLTPKTLLMDVGSTKRNVVEAARSCLGQHLGSFVPAHPIAGKESAGVEHADADLYAGKQVILTPIERTLTTHLANADKLWTALGCKVRHMSPEAHDGAYAAVSHLPHLLAFAYMNGIHSQAQRDHFLSLAGPGFRDFTRIAASDPKVWRDIFAANQDELLQQAQHFQKALCELENHIKQGDTDPLIRLIAQASDTRSRWQLPDN